MNIGLDFRRGPETIPPALDVMAVRINTIWAKEHNPTTGGHTTITADTITADTITADAITAGTIIVDTIISDTITADTITVGTLTVSGSLSVASLTVSGAITAGSISTGSLTVTGTLTAGHINTSSLTVTGTLTAGDMNASSLSVTGHIDAWSLTVIGPVTAVNVSASSLSVSGTVTAGATTVSQLTVSHANNPRLAWRDQSQATDAKVFEARHQGGQWHIAAVNDAQSSIQATPLTLSRNGNVSVGNNLTVTGSIAGTTVTASQTVTANADAFGYGLYLQANASGTAGLQFRGLGGTPAYGGLWMTGTGLLNTNCHVLPENTAANLSLGSSSTQWNLVWSRQHVATTLGGFSFTNSDLYGMYYDSSNNLIFRNTEAALFWTTPGAFFYTTCHVLPYTTAHNLYLGTDTNKWWVVYAQTGTIQTSDMRLKTGIRDNRFGLDFINRIETFGYEWKAKEGGGRVHYGVSAQQLETLGFDALYVPATDDESYSLNYSELIGPLIKALQELSRKVDRCVPSP